MRVLSYLHRYVSGQIACRSLRPFAAGERSMLAIPGGPGLGGEYLEPFLLSLAKASGMNVALIDLPNHGESVLSKKNGSPLDYPQCLAMLQATMEQVARETGEIVLFGQSLGARLAFDILAREARIKTAVLAGFPCRFESSKALEAQLAKVTLEDFTGGPEDEAVFARNWRKVLPFYTPRPLPPDTISQLLAGTKWLGNERMLENVPPLETAAAELRKRAPAVSVIVGTQDRVVPDGNLGVLKEALPYAEFREVAEAGHFVMAEKPAETLTLVADFLKKVGDRS